MAAVRKSATTPCFESLVAPHTDDAARRRSPLEDPAVHSRGEPITEEAKAVPAAAGRGAAPRYAAAGRPLESTVVTSAPSRSSSATASIAPACTA